jgi:hypothetical protein
LEQAGGQRLMKTLSNNVISRSSDVLLLIVFCAAVGSRYFPNQSSAITLIAISLVSAFFAFVLITKRSVDTANAPVPEVYEATRVEVAQSTLTQPKIRSSWNVVQFWDAHQNKDVIPFMYVSNFDKFAKAQKAHRPEHKKFDLTDSLPDDCTVTIGMFEITLKNGETSIKAASSGARRSVEGREVFIGNPPSELEIN